MTAARRASWSRRANCTLIAREINYDPGTIKAQTGIAALTWAFAVGASDENRTRTISLGSGAATATRRADLAVRPVPSDRDCPLVTLANGPAILI